MALVELRGFQLTRVYLLELLLILISPQHKNANSLR